MARDDVEKFGPFGRASGVGHVASDEHKIERPNRVFGFEPRHDLFQALVAARAGPSALDAKAIALADDMDVGEMRDAPDAAARGRGVERFEVERLVHARVREAPDERRRREIGRHDDDCVGEGRQDQLMRRRKVMARSDPSRPRPDGVGDERRDDDKQHSGAGAA